MYFLSLVCQSKYYCIKLSRFKVAPSHLICKSWRKNPLFIGRVESRILCHHMELTVGQMAPADGLGTGSTVSPSSAFRVTPEPQRSERHHNSGVLCVTLPVERDEMCLSSLSLTACVCFFSRSCWLNCDILTSSNEVIVTDE